MGSIDYPIVLTTTAVPVHLSVSDPQPTYLDREDKRSFLHKLAEFIHPGPDSAAELIQTLAEAQENKVIDADVQAMLEGVLRMADMVVGDVMVPAIQVDMLNIADSYDHLLNVVIDTAHERFPVYQDERDNIIGILLAKDLLKLQRSPHLTVRDLLRPVVFIPESKGLNDLLGEFQSQHHHQAMVMDEFGRIAGLITLSDVLSEIVGEIEDEFDMTESHGDIFSLPDHSFRVSADTSLERLTEVMGVRHIDADIMRDFKTLGALMTHQMGRRPRRGEHQIMSGLDFRVLHAKGGVVKWFKVSPVANESS